MNSLLGRGTFVLSIDLELDEGTPRYPVCLEVVDALLELMEKSEIRATWAVLGEAFTRRDSADAVAHQPREMRETSSKPSHNFSSSSSIPPGNSQNVIERILSCKVPQEIGCHTFSHMRVGDPGCSRESFESDLEACRSAAAGVGVTLHSFVFPWNSVGHLDSLRKYGYIVYRGRSADWFARLPACLRRPAHLIDHWLLIPSPAAIVARENGVWNLPASYFYACGAGWRKMIPISLRVSKVKQGLRRAARNKCLFHLWFHPFNLATSPQVWLKGLEDIFGEVSRYREKGELQNSTMGELARELQAST